jgi:hypothetical protein
MAALGEEAEAYTSPPAAYEKNVWNFASLSQVSHCPYIFTKGKIYCSVIRKMKCP